MSQLAICSIWEGNPYRPILKNSDDATKFLTDLAPVLRDQHNANQLGDATFHWSELTKTSVNPILNVGAKGKFLHPTFGIIHAVYVQYGTVTVIGTGRPVGWQERTTGFAWEATDRKDLSAASLICGVSGSYASPRGGEYGWVITDGINIQSVLVYNATIPVLGSELGWYAAGYLTVVTTGIIARVIAPAAILPIDSTHWELPPGSLKIGR